MALTEAVRDWLRLLHLLGRQVAAFSRPLTRRERSDPRNREYQKLRREKDEGTWPRIYD
jgi:hypothetical protein